MEREEKNGGLRSLLKFTVVAVISLLLLIPLTMVREVIRERDYSKQDVRVELADSYGGPQVIQAPMLQTEQVIKPRKTGEKADVVCYEITPQRLDYRAEVSTQILHRSIYDEVVYSSQVEVVGKISLSSDIDNQVSAKFMICISDFKGLKSIPKLNFAGREYQMHRLRNSNKPTLIADVDLPQGAKRGDELDFELFLELNGMESLSFQPSGVQTTLNLSSSYPHPSFCGAVLPDKREVSAEGFTASWSVLDININNSSEMMGVKFVDPANPYQQAMRSAKYGILIIILIFVAGLLVEMVTHRSIGLVQYAVIGLSLVLFYSLLMAFSEFISFFWAYFIAAVMTTASLTLYFRAILHHRSSYLLALFVAMVYLANYLLLQMQTYALLAGSLMLFVLLVLIMYFTSRPSTEPESR